MNSNWEKPVCYRVLIIEDDPSWFEVMKKLLEFFANDYGITLEIEVTDNCEDTYRILERNLFHTITIDLRQPEKKGGTLTSAPIGSNLALYIFETKPLVYSNIFTAYAQEHAFELYRKNLRSSNNSAPPIWEKTNLPNDPGGEDRYTQKEWADRILTLILPRAQALQIPLVSQRSYLNEHLSMRSHLGEGLEFSITAGRKYLPPGIARSCALIHRWFEDKHPPRYELHAYNEALLLAEIVQNWLWIQACALLTAMSQPQHIYWPIENTRAGMEKSLQAMLKKIAENDAGLAVSWLSHLHLRNPAHMNIIDALRSVRLLRNDQYHNSGNDDLPWEQLALPLRVILDAASYLASYPVVFRPRPAPDNRWRFSILRGETSPFPEEEWLITFGKLVKKDSFTPNPDNPYLYQLWPCADGSYELLNLWPFTEQKSVDGTTVWSLLCGLDQRNPEQIWERDIVDNRINISKNLSSNRARELKQLRAANATTKPKD